MKVYVIHNCEGFSAGYYYKLIAIMSTREEAEKRVKSIESLDDFGNYTDLSIEEITLDEVLR